MRVRNNCDVRDRVEAVPVGPGRSARRLLHAAAYDGVVHPHFANTSAAIAGETAAMIAGGAVAAIGTASIVAGA